MRLSGFQVLNLGYGATGPLIQFATLIEYAIELKPDVIVWFFFEGNDFYNLSRERQHPLLMKYLTQPGFTQQLALRQSNINKILNRKIREAEQRKQKRFNRAVYEPFVKRLKLTHVRRVFGLITPPQTIGNYAETGDDLELLSTILANAAGLTDEWKGKLYFVYLPEYARFLSVNQKSQLEERRRTVLKIAEDLNIYTIDTVLDFETVADPLLLFPFGLPGHYNASGYKLVADAVRSKLRPKSEGTIRP